MGGSQPELNSAEEVQHVFYLRKIGVLVYHGVITFVFAFLLASPFTEFLLQVRVVCPTRQFDAMWSIWLSQLLYHQGYDIRFLSPGLSNVCSS